MKPQFFTQARMTKNSVELQSWENSCHGHDDFDSAVTCHEHHSAYLRGELTVTDPLLLIALSVHNEMKKQGFITELRIVKRTYTEEVLEHA